MGAIAWKTGRHEQGTLFNEHRDRVAGRGLCPRRAAGPGKPAGRAAASSHPAAAFSFLVCVGSVSPGDRGLRGEWGVAINN